jgi:hypothetical protein
VCGKCGGMGGKCLFVCLFRATNETATRCTARKRGKAGKTTRLALCDS